MKKRVIRDLTTLKLAMADAEDNELYLRLPVLDTSGQHVVGIFKVQTTRDFLEGAFRDVLADRHPSNDVVVYAVEHHDGDIDFEIMQMSDQEIRALVGGP